MEKRGFRARVKADLHIEYGDENLASYKTWPELDAVNHHVVAQGVTALNLPRWTLGMDGTVLSTGLSVERATRGYNPHHRKNPSYYPITLMLAQTGHVIGHKNRTGRVHDSHQSARFLRDNVRSVRNEMAFRGVLEFRADGAFFPRQVLETCDSLNLEYAIRVPMWPWLNIRGVVKKKRKKDWVWVDRAKKVRRHQQDPRPASPLAVLQRSGRSGESDRRTQERVRIR